MCDDDDDDQADDGGGGGSSVDCVGSTNDMVLVLPATSSNSQRSEQNTGIKVIYCWQMPQAGSARK